MKKRGGADDEAFGVSARTSARFHRRRTRRDVASALYVLGYGGYLAWRLTIINPDSLALSWIYFAAECMGFVLGLALILTSRRYHHRATSPAPAGLSVDVLVPTYKEPLELIRTTLAAAKGLRYPHRTYVLDDGRRPELKALAEELGVEYRSRGKNVHAKAGNLNFGLEQSLGEFVMVLDADHVAMPHALDVLLGFFSDPRVAIAQTPQDYYNTDAFQYMNSRRGLWHDQSFFYNVAQPCRDSFDGASCVGTGAVYRRAALDAIGGIPVDTVTEDVHTSLKLHKAGWKLAYLNEPVAYGVAATDLKEYYRTRHRWAHGNLHALRLENVLFCSGLTLRQRFAYLSLGLIYLEGWQQLLLYLLPAAALFFGLQPFRITVFNILVVLAFPLAQYGLLQEIGCGFSRLWTNEIFAMARWPIHIVSTIGLLGLPLAWHPSHKDVKGRIYWDLMIPQLTVLAVSLGASAYGIWRLHGHWTMGPVALTIAAWITGTRTAGAVGIFDSMPSGYTADLVLIAGFWAMYNALRAALFVAKAVRNARRSHRHFRLTAPAPVALEPDRRTLGRVVWISQARARLRLFADVKPSAAQPLALTMFLPQGAERLELVADHVHRVCDGAIEIEGALSWPSAESKDRINQTLFTTDWHRRFLEPPGYFLTPSDAFAFLARAGRSGRTRWFPLLYRPADGPDLAFGLGSSQDAPDGSGSLMAFGPVEPGKTYTGWSLDGDRPSPFRLHAFSHGRHPVDIS